MHESIQKRAQCHQQELGHNKSMVEFVMSESFHLFISWCWLVTEQLVAAVHIDPAKIRTVSLA